MPKKVLILCTGNSCRSIIAEALINAELETIEAYSAGVKASGKVNSHAQKLLENKGQWKESYHSKSIEALEEIDFDLVVTVCDHAHETCPFFPSKVQMLHVGFTDPDGKDYQAFEETYQDIKTRLLPKVLATLNDSKGEHNDSSL